MDPLVVCGLVVVVTVFMCVLNHRAVSGLLDAFDVERKRWAEERQRLTAALVARAPEMVLTPKRERKPAEPDGEKADPESLVPVGL